jgi:hypothetical protein
MDQIIERWLPVAGYEGLYEVSDMGRVRSLDRICYSPKRGAQKRKGTILVNKVNKNRLSYRQVTLWKEGTAVYLYVHRLVLSAFAGPGPDGKQCAHGDGDTGNNRLTNLRWATIPENMSDKKLHGTDSSGERNGAAKLTEDQVRVIRLEYARHSYHDSNSLELAQRYRISRASLGHIVNRKTWTHL